jgi:hypothetical protein
LGKMKKALQSIVALSLLFSLVAGTMQLGTGMDVPTPAALQPPNFSVNYSSNPYIVAPTTSTDPYTGINVTIPAHQVDNQTIQLNITPQTISIPGDLHYAIRYKGHFEQNWVTIGFMRIPSSSRPQTHPLIITFSSSGGGWYFYPTLSDLLQVYSPAGSVDFQVKVEVWDYVSSSGPLGGWAEAMLGASDWSSIQTLIIPASSSPEPSTSPSLMASLSESASALNFGNIVNFTVSTNGGTKPYTYAWFIDNQMLQTTALPYYSTNTQAVGSHHVYVQVTDAGNNSATTLTVEFNVLPISSTSTSPSPTLSNSPTQQPTIEPTLPAHSFQDPNYNLIIIIVGAVLVIAAIAGTIVYFKKTKK